MKSSSFGGVTVSCHPPHLSHAFLPTIKTYLLNLVSKATQTPSPTLTDCYSVHHPAGPWRLYQPRSVAHTLSCPSLLSHSLSHSSLAMCYDSGRTFRGVLPWSLFLRGPWLNRSIPGGLSQDEWMQGSASSKKVGPSLPRAFGEGWSWALTNE